MVGIKISSQFCGFQHFSKSCCKSRTWLKLRGKKSILLRSNGAVFGLRIINPCNIWQLLASFTEALASKDFDLDVVRTWYLVPCTLYLASWSLLVFFGNSRELVLAWPHRPLLVWIIAVLMTIHEACQSLEASKIRFRLYQDLKLTMIVWRLINGALHYDNLNSMLGRTMQLVRSGPVLSLVVVLGQFPANRVDFFVWWTALLLAGHEFQT